MREIWANCNKNIIYFGLPLLGGLSLVLVSIINFFAISYWFAVPCVVGIVLTIKAIPFVKTFRVSSDVYQSRFGVVRLQHYTILKYGEARSGKTLTSVAEAVYSSQVLWDKLSRLYQSMSKRSLIPENMLNEKFVSEFDEVQRAYEFWINRSELIPCLFSNIKIRFFGQISADLSIEHFRQNKWLPAYTVCLCDEIGRFLGVEKSTAKEAVINDFICWIGQFCECHLIATEQRPTNVMLDLRGVIGVNECVSMSKIWSAKWLLSILDKLDARAHQRGWSPEAFEKLAKLRKWADKVGFLRFSFETMGNLEFGNKDREKREYAVLADTQFEYASRAFKNLWLAQDLEDDNTADPSMFVSSTSDIAQSIYARYEVNDNE